VRPERAAVFVAITTDAVDTQAKLELVVAFAVRAPPGVTVTASRLVTTSAVGQLMAIVIVPMSLNSQLVRRLHTLKEKLQL
jgi:hypothetical protein